MKTVILFGGDDDGSQGSLFDVERREQTACVSQKPLINLANGRTELIKADGMIH